MKNIVCLFVLLFAFSICFGQSRKCTSYKDTSGQEIFKEVDQMPKFAGSSTGLMNYITEKLGWPAGADNIGLIVVSYVIDEKGKVSDVKLLRKSDRTEINDKVIRAMEEMPVWIPGQCNGKLVKVEMVLPIKFSLSN